MSASTPPHAVGTCSLEGPNHKNEDRIITMPNAYTDTEGTVVHVYGVLDGHGGNAVADYVSENVVKVILKPEKFPIISKMKDDEIVDIISNGFHSTDIRAIKRARKNKDWSGACCLLVFIINSKLFVANLGDCRVLKMQFSKGKFAGKAKALSNDHQPLLDRARIERAGGWIDPTGRVLGVLGCARSFGDREFKYQEDRALMLSQKKIDVLKKAKKEAAKQNNQMFGKKVSTQITDKLVVAIPEIKVVQLTDADGLLMIASDGIWDYCSNSKALSLVKKHHKSGLSLEDAAKEICTFCRTSGSGMNADDISCVLVDLSAFWTKQ
eukprot:TRINITY_DN524_c0_g1_i4.p2 TRINITY_DN524_c0_g1~~TRINITY_DN524_c0_g1_i4.p2  ORF type:complete len:324 (-),score=74.51 TRINITY_DN524_c0_g1_i4:211-1182(-)